MMTPVCAVISCSQTWIPLVIATHNINKGSCYWRETKGGDKWQQADITQIWFQEWEKCDLAESIWRGIRCQRLKKGVLGWETI